jgi:hypothetical protein
MNTIRTLSAALLILSAGGVWAAPAPFLKPSPHEARARLAGTWQARWVYNGGERRGVFWLKEDGGFEYAAEGAGTAVQLKGTWRYRASGGGKEFSIILSTGGKEGRWPCRWVTAGPGDEGSIDRFELTEKGQAAIFRR